NPAVSRVRICDAELQRVAKVRVRVHVRDGSGDVGRLLGSEDHDWLLRERGRPLKEAETRWPPERAAGWLETLASWRTSDADDERQGSPGKQGAHHRHSYLRHRVDHVGKMSVGRRPVKPSRFRRR